MFLTAILSLAMLVVIIMTMREVWNFHRKREVSNLRRMTLRLSMSAMLLFLFLSILIGVKVFGLNEPAGISPDIWLAFWGCIIILTGGIICLAIADLQTIGDDALKQANTYWEDIAKTLAERGEKEPEDRHRG